MSSMADVGGLEPIFLRVAPTDIALVKFVFESYEGVGIVRTLDRHAALVVALVSRDFLADAWGIVADLQQRIECAVVAAPPEAGEDWLLALMQDEG
jgi:hypothetical protein